MQHLNQFILFILFSSFLLHGQSQKHHFYLIQGLSGTPAHLEKHLIFRAELKEALEKFENCEFSYLEPSIGEQEKSSNAQNILKLLKDEQDLSTWRWLIFLGHGKTQANNATFLVDGPDLKATELRQSISKHPRTILVFLCSASATFNEVCKSSPSKILAASNKNENDNEPELAELFTKALSLSNDKNKDKVLDLAEIFKSCKTLIHQRYEENNWLQWERPILEANGDGKATMRPSASDDFAASEIRLTIK